MYLALFIVPTHTRKAIPMAQCQVKIPPNHTFGVLVDSPLQDDASVDRHFLLCNFRTTFYLSIRTEVLHQEVWGFSTSQTWTFSVTDLQVPQNAHTQVPGFLMSLNRCPSGCAADFWENQTTAAWDESLGTRIHLSGLDK